MGTKKNTGKLYHPETISPREKKIFDIVKRVVDKADLHQLLDIGAPGDEYDPESMYIMQAIVREGGKKLGVTELAHIIALVFHLQYDMWARPVRYLAIHFEMAKELQKKLAAAGI